MCLVQKARKHNMTLQWGANLTSKYLLVWLLCSYNESPFQIFNMCNKMCSWIWFDSDYAQIGRLKNKIQKIYRKRKKNIRIMIAFMIAFVITLSLLRLGPCFHNSKMNFLEWTLKFPGNYRNFLKLKNVAVCVLHVRESSQFAQHKRPVKKRIVHCLEVVPSTKQIETGLCERANWAS